MQLTCIYILCFCCFFVAGWPKYRSNKDIEVYLRKYVERFGNIANLYSIGKTLQNADLLVMEISAAGDKLGTPNVKLIANIHGNEPVGREILLEFLEYFGTKYGADERITWLLNNTRIHVMPTMNPDGFVRAVHVCNGTQGRENSRRADLNRNFPDYYHKGYIERQLETDAIMQWMDNITFVLSASLHSGALVVNYPFDTEKEHKWQKFFKKYLGTRDGEEEDELRRSYIASMPYNPASLTPDNDVFIYLASSYANAHPTMHKGNLCPEYNFTGGITNGAEWYTLTGGMQDYNYAMKGCMELTLELSCCKYPPAKELSRLWKENKEPLIQFCMQAHEGVKGIIKNATTSDGIPDVELKIKGRDISFSTNKRGEFWRILRPGLYVLEVTLPRSNRTFNVSFTLNKNNSKFPKPLFITTEIDDDFDIEVTFIPNQLTTTTTTTSTTTEISTTTTSTTTTQISPEKIQQPREQKLLNNTSNKPSVLILIIVISLVLTVINNKSDQ